MTMHARAPAPAAAMTIGEASRASGVSAKMIRHYEAIGLLQPAARKDSNYRLYGPGDVHALRFIARARSLGFPICTIAELLALWRDRSRSNAEVRRLAQRHADELRRKLAQLQGMIAALDHLLGTCPGDGLPECPILDDLAGHSGPWSLVPAARDETPASTQGGPGARSGPPRGRLPGNGRDSGRSQA